ncbi:MAG: hypothetical protein AB3N14_03315 [Flavobacteriaceae bacterium]
MSESLNSTDKYHWSEAEKWAWEEIIAGRKANFNKKYKTLDPKKEEGWDSTTNDRTISAKFLSEILTDQQLSAKAYKKGVRIIGAYFKETLDLKYTKLDYQLWLDDCRFMESLNLDLMKIDDWFSLEGSHFE